MSISTNREAKRLDITTTAVVKTTESLNRIRKQIAEAEAQDVSEPQVLTLLTLRADLVSQDLDLAALLVKQNLQTQAFRRQEADYPAALKRHLRRCKKFGWTDSRLAGARK